MSNVAFDRIVRTYGEALSRVAWGYVDGAADHDDLLQDILVAIWQALPRFRGDASERTFVFRIAQNRGCTFVTRRHHHEPLNDNAPIPDPSLPEAQRQAVLLRLEGFSLGEIAALQATSEANVSVRLTRGRDRLRELLGGSEE